MLGPKLDGTCVDSILFRIAAFRVALKSSSFEPIFFAGEKLTARKDELIGRDRCFFYQPVH